MKLILIKKNCGSKNNPLLKDIIKEYIKILGKNDILFSYPGFLSNTQKTINLFCNEFSNILNNNKVFLSNGMNGNQYVSKNNKTIIDSHCPPYNRTNTVNKKDHSKFIFFINNDCNMANALLIGSSNLSYNTYFKPTIDKGECDIFLINEYAFDNNTIDEFIKVINKQNNYFCFSTYINNGQKTQDNKKESQTTDSEFDSLTAEMGIKDILNGIKNVL